MQYIKGKDGCSWQFTNEDSGLHLAQLDCDPKHDYKTNFTFYESATKADQEQIKQLGLKLKWKLKKRDALSRSIANNTIPNGLKILILCEGETEKCYLDALCEELVLCDEVEVKVSKLKDPADAFESAVKQYLYDRFVGQESYSEIWLVFDRDGHRGFGSAVGLAEKVPFVHLAFTNPCFEYWLLLHLDEFLPESLPFDRERVTKTEVETFEVTPLTKMRVTEEILSVETKPESCLKALKALMPSYQKNDPKVFETFASKMSSACRRASLEPHRGHGSTMPKLIDRLYRLAGKVGIL